MRCVCETTRAFGLGILLIPAAIGMAAETTDKAIEAIRAVGPQGAGNVTASAAVQSLSQGKVDDLVPILAGFDGANPLATNWLRAAFESLADRILKSGGELPKDRLEKFILDLNNSPEARRLAYEWLVRVDPTATDRLIPGMLQDPNAEFRRDAVARLIASAKALKEDGKDDEAVAAYKEALAGAVDDDQVKAIVEPLKAAGVEVDLQQHFGFLTNWKLIGPFDNVNLVGFEAVYPPEEKLDFAAKYEGKMGEVKWTEAATKDDYGVVDLAETLSPFKGAVVYAATEFISDQERTVQMRLGTPNAWKLWVNGELLFARDEYHRGMQLDQYRVTANLKPGRNTILLKVCQNEQTEDWAQAWRYQLRVCTPGGAAILSADSMETTSR